jgi:hypothetical protein
MDTKEKKELSEIDICDLFITPAIEDVGNATKLSEALKAKKKSWYFNPPSTPLNTVLVKPPSTPMPLLFGEKLFAVPISLLAPAATH